MTSTNLLFTQPTEVPQVPSPARGRIPECSDESLRSSKVMIVDDEPINVKLAQKYLSLGGYRNFVSTHDSRQALALIEAEQPDVLLLDIMMPHVSGLDILGTLRGNPLWTHLPIVILTASNDHDTKRRALELGASDFLNKPVDPSELLPRIHNVLMVKKHHDHIQRYSHELESEVLRRTAELARSRQEVIHCLARAAEFRDDDTGKHVMRVGRYARLIAEQLGWPADAAAMLEQAAQLHDIGKIGIPDAILLKPGKLTREEFEIMQKHSGYGRQITHGLPENENNILCGHTELGSRLLASTESPILALAAVISMSHHERWDGSGYPLRLAGEKIPLEGRITAVADVFDALSTRRPYKHAFPLEECFQILEDGRNTHFDPRVLDAFFARGEDVIRTHAELADGD